jgi:hypothetical protein
VSAHGLKGISDDRIESHERRVPFRFVVDA